MLTKTERRYRLEQMTTARMFGLTIREIAKRHNLSKTHVHRLLKDVAVVRNSRNNPRRNPECAACRTILVPCSSGTGYAIIAMP
jgi:hypothetical protein